VPKTPGKGYFALGKAFAGCSTRQRATGKKSVGKDFFVGCFLSSTRQRLCRVQTRHPAKKNAVTVPAPSALGLPGAMSEALGKDFLIYFSNFLCRVPYREAPGKDFLIFFYNFFAGCRAAGAPGKEFFNFF
jgi:hypothetical protein